MKKLISMILTTVVLLCSVCLNVSAKETENIREKLQILIEYLDEVTGVSGNYRPFQNLWGKPYYEVKNGALLNTDEDYQKAYDEITDGFYNDNIKPDNAWETLEKAKAEQNFDDWYTESEWSEFQSSIAALEDALNDYSEIGQMLDIDSGEPVWVDYYIYDDKQEANITEKYFDLVYAFNKMTNRDFIRGDVDGSGAIDVRDVTLTQKYIAGMRGFTSAMKMRANVEYRGDDLEPEINDVTAIQKYIAGMITEFNIGEHQCIVVSDVISYESEDYLLGNMLNYYVCSRETGYGPNAQYGEYRASILQGFYRECIDRGINY